MSFLQNEDVCRAVLFVFLLNPSRCVSIIHFSVFVSGRMCVCFCIHSVAIMYQEGALAIVHITFTYKAWLLSGKNMRSTLPKVAAILADSKVNTVGYFRITIGSIAHDFLPFLDVFAFLQLELESVAAL